MIAEQEIYQVIAAEQIDSAQKLKELWRGIPILERTAAVLNDILAHPEKYQIEKASYGTTESLAKEVEKSHGMPPSSVTFTYELPPYVNGSVQEATLKVKFFLCSSVLATERFEPHVSLIFRSGIDEDVIETPYVLSVVQSTNGPILESRGCLRSDSGRKQIESTIGKILALKDALPRSICCITQGGIKATIHPKVV